MFRFNAILLFPALALASLVQGHTPASLRGAAARREQTLEIRQSNCPIGDLPCADGQSCCPIGHCCGVWGGALGCCPNGKTCVANSNSCEVVGNGLCTGETSCCRAGAGTAGSSSIFSHSGSGGGSHSGSDSSDSSSGSDSSSSSGSSSGSGSSDGSGSSSGSGISLHPIRNSTRTGSTSRVSSECGFIGAVTIIALTTSLYAL